MIFFLSRCDSGEQAIFLVQLGADLAAAPASVRERLLPAIVGLHHVLDGGTFDSGGKAGDGRRLTGWTTGRHWLRRRGSRRIRCRGHALGSVSKSLVERDVFQGAVRQGGGLSGYGSCIRAGRQRRRSSSGARRSRQRDFETDPSPGQLGHQGVGVGGGITGGRSSQVIVFGSINGASQPPSLPPRSVRPNSDPAGGS